MEETQDCSCTECFADCPSCREERKIVKGGNMPITDKLCSMLPMEDIEQSAIQQIYDVLRLDCLKKLAIMRDCHAGYDLPIGSVALLDGYISPSFVGYDIGCGMNYFDTKIPVKDVFYGAGTKQKIFNDIVAEIPTGFNCRKESFDDLVGFKSAHGNAELDKRVNEKCSTQMGTLGGGNHFIELGENRAGNLGITLHSGSRNAGHTIGGYYMKLGRMLPIDSDLGKAYLQDMNFALSFALVNRIFMLKVICSIIGIQITAGIINENHNHAVVTENGVLHRKGATPADKGQLGVIPANMRDGVYITMGLGNDDYLSSAPHGCGRLMGRNVAKRTLDLEVFKDQMVGITACVGSSTLDEAPDAYKDADFVMRGTEGVVVNIIDHVKPLINIKG